MNPQIDSQAEPISDDVNNKRLWLPCISKASGQLLSMNTWHALGVYQASVHLSDLLSRPGVKTLSELNSLSAWLGWGGELLLNGQSFPLDKMKKRAEGVDFRSPFDGGKHHLSASDCLKWVALLDVDAYLLTPSKHEADWWSIESKPYINALSYLENASQSRPYGLSYLLSDFDNLDALLTCFSNQQNNDRALKHYIVGELSVDEMTLAFEKGATVIESNWPLQAAIEGKVLTANGTISILDKSCAEHFSPLCEQCDCVICQQYSCAYFHHLHQHTPLLSQRLLAEHNVHHIQTCCLL